LATNRPRRIIATLLALVALAGLSAPAALAARLRVEAPHRTVFQGRATPFVGTLKGHTTTQKTALGALVTAARRTPFSLGLKWSDAFGGAWNGFYLASIAGITAPPATAFWAIKVNQKLSSNGIGSTVVHKRDNVLVYYTTFDPDTFATQPTLGLRVSDRTPEARSAVTFTVLAYDDAGTATPAANAWVWIDGVGTRTDQNGTATVRLRAGRFHVRATSPGDIRSRSLWVRAS
jgi:hypothetical protein